MFNSYSILSYVNIIIKFISFILILIALFFIKEPIILLFISLFLLLNTYEYKNIFIINLFTFIIIIISILTSKLLLICKIFTLIIYTLLVKKVTKKEEVRYLIENSLYHLKNRKITYKLSYILYFINNFFTNINRFKKIRKESNIKFNFSYLLFSIKNSYYNSKNKKEDFIILNNIRFYNIYNKRTNINKISFERWDFNYLFCHLIIFMLIIYYGR